MAFFSGVEAALKRVPVAGGSVERLATLPGQNCSGDWHGAVILMACSASKGIQRLTASGGAPTAVTSLDRLRGEITHLWPQFLPDGEHFIYRALAESEAAATYVGSLKGGTPIKLVETSAMARFAAPDRLLFVRGDALMSQAVDMNTFSLVGEPIMAKDDVMTAPNTRVGVSTSANGVEVIASGPPAAPSSWSRGRAGQRLQPAIIESPVTAPPWAKLSPDGRSLAFVRGPKADVWVRDLARGIASRVSTNELRATQLPVWMPDGRRLVYRSEGGPGGRLSLHMRDVASLEPERLLYEGVAGSLLVPEDISPDGQYLILRDNRSAKGTALMVLPLDGTAEPSVYLRDGFRTSWRPSRRTASGGYTSDETGQQQLFVRSFPDATRAKHQVSNETALHPRWRRDGRELYFVDRLNRVSVTPVDLRSGFTSGPPTPLFEIPQSADVFGGVNLGAVFDVSPDGQHFVFVAPRAMAAAVTLNVAVNWMADLKK